MFIAEKLVSGRKISEIKWKTKEITMKIKFGCTTDFGYELFVAKVIKWVSYQSRPLPSSFFGYFFKLKTARFILLITNCLTTFLPL